LGNPFAEVASVLSLLEQLEHHHHQIITPTVFSGQLEEAIKDMGTPSRTWPLATLLLTVATVAGRWYQLVDRIEPNPYLVSGHGRRKPYLHANKPQDEIFHVPQAQKYCQGEWHSWDPKITTPPGLYLVAWAFSLITGSCNTSALRALNVSAICIVSIQAYDILRQIDRRSSSNQEHDSLEKDDPAFWSKAHSALNIALFPPLFFFSGLFYTDVMSTLFVLLSYDAFLKRPVGGMKATDDFKAILIGIVALLFRQTNIFWVAVFPAGLATVNTLRHNAHFKSEGDARQILEASWREGQVYDPLVEDASLSG